MKQPSPTEKEVQAVIMEYLMFRSDILVWRNNSGAFKTESGGFVRFGAKGSPDILGVMRGGRFLGIEVKRKGKKQTEDQKQFQKEIERHGGLYILAYSLDDVIKIIK